jgi:hypothetical protein
MGVHCRASRNQLFDHYQGRDRFGEAQLTEHLGGLGAAREDLAAILS